MNEILDRLNKITACLYKLTKQSEDIEYRLIMLEEAIKDGNQSLEAIKHNIMKHNTNS
jgi:chaperonin cofactor prefoldin